jgi:hypothetical protein
MQELVHDRACNIARYCIYYRLLHHAEQIKIRFNFNKGREIASCQLCHLVIKFRMLSQYSISSTNDFGQSFNGKLTFKITPSLDRLGPSIDLNTLNWMHNYMIQGQSRIRIFSANRHLKMGLLTRETWWNWRISLRSNLPRWKLKIFSLNGSGWTLRLSRKCFRSHAYCMSCQNCEPHLALWAIELYTQIRTLSKCQKASLFLYSILIKAR